MEYSQLSKNKPITEERKDEDGKQRIQNKTEKNILLL